MAHALYNPNLLQNATYQRFRERLGRVAAVTQDDVDLIFAARLGWSDAAFSHFGLQRQSRAEIVATVDSDSQPAIVTTRRGNVAITRVNTFLGEQAMSQIDAAFVELAASPPSALIVDLRATPGGSLASRTLIEGLIFAPETMGWFISNAWWQTHTANPTPEQIAAEPTVYFDDPTEAMQRLMSVGVVNAGVRPRQNRFNGPVYVFDRSRNSKRS